MWLATLDDMADTIHIIYLRVELVEANRIFLRFTQRPLRFCENVDAAEWLNLISDW